MKHGFSMSQIGEPIYNGAVFEVKKEIQVNLICFVTNRGKGRLNPMPRTTIPISCLLTSLFLILTLPGEAADKADDEQSLRNAATVLQAMVASKDVPASVVAKADCIIILPSVKSSLSVSEEPEVAVRSVAVEARTSAANGRHPLCTPLVASAPGFRLAARLAISFSLSWRLRRLTRFWTARSKSARI